MQRFTYLMHLTIIIDIVYCRTGPGTKTVWYFIEYLNIWLTQMTTFTHPVSQVQIMHIVLNTLVKNLYHSSINIMQIYLYQQTSVYLKHWYTYQHMYT